jgi:ankyrin repeat protein
VGARASTTQRRLASGAELVKRDDHALQSQLLELLRAIAEGERERALELVTEAPTLACSALARGATRNESSAYFFDRIKHYAYAGDTPLHWAAAACELEIARQLLARGADVHARNRRGACALHYASDGMPESLGLPPAAPAGMVELLLGAGADPNALDTSGVAPLHRAVRTRATSAVQSLLRGGARVGLRNGGGSSPLHLAVQDTGRSGSGAPRARQEQAEIIGLLLAHGADPSQQSSGGKSVHDCVKAAWIRELLAERSR